MKKTDHSEKINLSSFREELQTHQVPQWSHQAPLEEETMGVIFSAKSDHTIDYQQSILLRTLHSKVSNW